MLNRRNFFAAAAACLLTKKMPAWSKPKPKPKPKLLPVGHIWAPRIFVSTPYVTPTITMADFVQRRGIMARYSEACIRQEYFQEAKVTTEMLDVDHGVKGLTCLTFGSSFAAIPARPSPRSLP